MPNAIHKEAIKASKEGTRFVVYVFDQGYEVFTPEQLKMYRPFVHIECAYLSGVQISNTLLQRAI